MQQSDREVFDTIKTKYNISPRGTGIFFDVESTNNNMPDMLTLTPATISIIVRLYHNTLPDELIDEALKAVNGIILTTLVHNVNVDNVIDRKSFFELELDNTISSEYIWDLISPTGLILICDIAAERYVETLERLYNEVNGN